MSRRSKSQQSQSTEGEHRAQVILQVLSGQLGATAAAEQLGISVQRVYQLRDKAQAALTAACEPAQPGRPRAEPPHPDSVRAAELAQQVAQAKAELEGERLRHELGLFLPHVLTNPAPAPPVKKGRRTQRRRDGNG